MFDMEGRAYIVGQLKEKLEIVLNNKKMCSLFLFFVFLQIL